MTGGAAPKRRGRDFERKCKTALEQAGYWVTQTPPSYDGGVDLVAIRPGEILAVQCKRDGYVDPAGRRDLWGLRDQGMIPIRASWQQGIGAGGQYRIVWTRLDDPALGVGSGSPVWATFSLEPEPKSDYCPCACTNCSGCLGLE